MDEPSHFDAEPRTETTGFPTRVFLRPIGNPMPLGFLGLAVATMTLSGMNLGWIPTGEQHQVALVLLAFAFPLQSISTVFGFLSRDPVVASGIGVQAGTWLVVGLILLTAVPGSTSKTLGFFLFVAAAAVTSSVVVAGTTKVLPALVMAGTVARFALTGMYQFTKAPIWNHVSGWEGLFLCCIAVYAAIAIDLESVRHRTVLPVMRFGGGRKALTGSAADQVAGVEHEAGVRRQL